MTIRSGTLSLCAILCVLFLVSCNNADPIEKKPTLGNNYLPLKMEKDNIYTVDSVYFSIGNEDAIRKDSVHQIIRRQITDTSTAEDGRILYKVDRDIKMKSDQEWTSIRDWYAWHENGEVIMQEGNLPYIKMLKDIHLESQWNPHKYFDAQSIEVFIKANSLKPYTIPYNSTAISLDSREYAGETLDSVLTIELVDFDDNFITKRYSIERYAKEIGLVEKIEFIVDTQCRIKGGNPADCENLTWPDKAEAGYFMHQKIVEWK